MIWIIVIICIILICYVLSYYRYPQKSSILQTSLNQLIFDIFLEKQPVVIDDNNVNVEDLLNLYFRFSPKSMYKISTSETWHRNRYKYNIVQINAQPGSDATTVHELYLCQPSTTLDSEGFPGANAKVVAIQMRAGQVVVIPFHWYYNVASAPVSASNNSNVFVDCVGIHDLVTYMLP